MEKFLEKIEKMEIKFSHWILGFCGIIFVRFLLEAISNPSSSGVIASDPQTIVHYCLFYLVASVGSIFILQIFTKKGPNIANFMLFFLPIMWLGPIFDIFLSKGKGFSLAYISDGGTALIRDFFTFFGPSLFHGATIGIRIELAIVFLGVSWFVWNYTKSWLKTILGFFVSYVFVFLICALPGILFSVNQIVPSPSLNSGSSQGYLSGLILNSNIPANSVHSTFVPYSQQRLLEIGFDKLMSQFFFILLCFLLFLWFWNVKKEKIKAILANSRPERAGHYILLVILGIWSAFIGGFGVFHSWVDYMGAICLVISWYAVWVFAVNINDCEDSIIDEISNKNRPIPRNILTKDEMFQSGLIFLSLSLLGAYSVGFYQFFMVLVFIFASFIYSAKPLRLKVFPVISTFLMAVASLSSVLAGFFFISNSKVFYEFPPMIMIGILVCYTLLFNVKDLKDVKGDKADGIYTIPVVFGEKLGRQIVSVMFVMSFLLIPVFFQKMFLLIISVPVSIIGYYLIIKFTNKEKYLFVLYFIFLILGVVFFTPI